MAFGKTQKRMKSTFFDRGTIILTRHIKEEDQADLQDYLWLERDVSIRYVMNIILVYKGRVCMKLVRA